LKTLKNLEGVDNFPFGVVVKKESLLVLGDHILRR